MNQPLAVRYRSPGAKVLAWVAFYLLVHFNVNDEYLSFWVPMKFVVALPQTLFSVGVVYSFGWLFARPLDTPLWKLLLFAVGSFVLLHVVYYYALQAAQPFAPAQSVTHRRWVGFMAGQGPFYFLRNRSYLLTVSPYFFGLLIGLPLAAHLLHASRQESQQLAQLHRRRQAAAAAVRQHLNPAFFQQMLQLITHLLGQRQAELAAELTLKLAQVLRHTLYAARQEQVPLAHELDAYLDYVYLQEVRLQPQVDVTVRLTVEDSGLYTVLAGVLLPLTHQWLALVREACEIEVRVQQAQLTLTLWSNAAREPGPLAAPAVVARLAQYSPQASVLVGTPPQSGVLLTLHLPLALPLPPSPAAQN